MEDYDYHLDESDLQGDRTGKHLEECLLGRIRLSRIRRKVGVESYPKISSKLLQVGVKSLSPGKIEEGQLWLAEDTERMLVWIEGVNYDQGMVTVLAATTEVEFADQTSLICWVSGLGHDVVVYTSVVGWIPIDRLRGFVGTVDVGKEISELVESLEQPTLKPRLESCGEEEKEGLRVGRRISGDFDERLEFRQMLADQLADIYREE